jgi:hypothetical protein
LATFVGAFYRHTEERMTSAAHGEFTFLGRTVDFGAIGSIDWSYRLPEESDCFLWRMKLAQLDVLHSLVVSGISTHQDTAVALIDSFANSRSFRSPDAFSTVWSPYDTSHRLLAILSALAISASESGVPEELAARLRALARLDAGFLWRNVEHEMRNNHTERNLAALCFYYLAAGSISSRHANILDREVARIIRLTVLPDGMQAERSAMYQGLTVMSLRIFAACPFLSDTTRTRARDCADAAARAWLFLTHGDGEIALFNDSWVGEVPRPATVLDLQSTRPALSLPKAGYCRLSSGGVDAIMDAGEIGPKWNPAHGHPDFLSLEVDAYGRRFIVDPGTSQYSTGPKRDYERSWANHNGPHYAGVELLEYVGRFKVGRLTRATPLSAQALSRLTFDAIGGHITTPTGSCMRIVCAAPKGGLLVIDRWSSMDHKGVTNILVPGEWKISRQSHTRLLAQTGHAQVALTMFGGHIDLLQPKTWSCRYFESQPAVSVRLQPEFMTAGYQQLAFGLGEIKQEDAHGICAEVEGKIASLHGTP